MGHAIHITRRLLLLIFLASTGLLINQSLNFESRVRAQGSSPPGKAAQTADQTGRPASDQRCTPCHDQIVQSFAFAVHGKIQKRTVVECETCHGDATEHISSGGDVSKIRNPEKLKATESVHVCTGCHSQIREHSWWSGSRHESAGLSCTSCHGMHRSKAAPFALASENREFRNPVVESKLLKMRTEAETCYQCHSNIRKAQFQRSTHLFRNENMEHRIQCSSCHDPHGSIGPRLMRTASINETCYQCHTNLRGPVLWEHPPVSENCLTCHSAHGSNNRALLQVRLPMLCQSCHIQGRHQTVAGRANAAWVINRSCMNCHQAVHGSNHPSGTILQR